MFKTLKKLFKLKILNIKPNYLIFKIAFIRYFFAVNININNLLIIKFMLKPKISFIIIITFINFFKILNI